MSASQCIFCRISAGEIPCRQVYATSTVLAFHDIQPQAPTHILLIPRLHIATLNDFPIEQRGLAADLIAATQQIVRDLGLATRGYRVIINTNADAGQEVFHLHWHICGGQPLGKMLTINRAQ
ncbi:MAG: histidine triad nucleotide-binding protein [Deltaproteobacteria bacterium]|nr:histidine triad nucleotide-binding protein [Deltaproteobacteria bacterium]